MSFIHKQTAAYFAQSMQWSSLSARVQSTSRNLQLRGCGFDHNPEESDNPLYNNTLNEMGKTLLQFTRRWYVHKLYHWSVWSI